MKRLASLARLARPYTLAFALLTYLLGAALARYLGRFQSLAAFWLGLCITLFLLLAANALLFWFQPEKWQRDFWKNGETPDEKNWLRAASFHLAVGATGAAALAAFALLAARRLSASAAIFLLLLLLFAFADALPPIRLAESGYGEFVESAALALLVPAFGFLLQTDSYHRLLGMSAFPLTLLLLASYLLLDFESYARDTKTARPTLLTRMGWERGVHLHHALMLAAMCLFLAWLFLGIPAETLAPLGFILPFAALQSFHLQQIARGRAPRWKFLILLARTTPALAAYLLLTLFWLH